jgi:hypothetical protein
MASQSNIRKISSRRDDFDSLRPDSGVIVRPARVKDLATLARIARRTIPGADVGDARLRALCLRDRNTAFAFSRGSELIGGAAFLYLNFRGLDALLLDDIDLHDPDPRLLAGPDESPEAIYLWAISGAGRSALGHVSARFSSPQYRCADIYTRPVTVPGTKLFTGLGFEPTPSWSPNLWVYRRQANQPVHSPTLLHAA